MEKTFVLRKVGTASFVRALPHNFNEKNFVDGWENLASRAMCWPTLDAAIRAKAAARDGDCLVVEEV